LRRSEAAALAWDQVDMKARTLTVLDTKNREDHTLPLSDYLHDLLQQRKATAGGAYVFPGTGANGYLIEPRVPVQRVIKSSGVDFTLHDLRRTFLTVAESLDIPAYALKRLVNHKMRSDVTAGYIIADVERLRGPMQKITDFLLSVAGERRANVVTITEGRKAE
jgi:integrase